MPLRLPRPTISRVKSAIRSFDRDKKIAEAERTLSLVFKCFPNNSDFAHVLTKVAALNALYSTGILDVVTVANHILSCDIDLLLDCASPEAVEKIANVKFAKAQRRNYSFATKYCSWHKPSKYPIYDSRARATLIAYRKRDCFEKFTEQAIKSSYPEYVRVVTAFQNYYGLSQFSFKELDKFLWRKNG